ncbi:MAG: DUF2806 domain-containing protein [Robiginitomaculum sp.]|nr:DUF2806 domain-containing protein [Robiginitomaculum sp.]
MSDTDGRSLVNLGEFTKPVTVLIEKMSDAAGVLYEPHRIRKAAQAKADSVIIAVRAQIEITDLNQRALERFIKEESQKQENIEAIISGAIPLIEDASNPDVVENDWMANFFDKCRLTSDDEMQILWSKVLAGEANQPGKYSTRAINLLAALDKKDAEFFTKLCGFSLSFIENISPFIDNLESDIYKENGITEMELQYLDNLGLIRFIDVGQLGITIDIDVNNARLIIVYFGKTTVLRKDVKANERIAIGRVTFTKIGRQLSQICGSQAVPGFEEYAIEKMITKGWQA